MGQKKQTEMVTLTLFMSLRKVPGRTLPVGSHREPRDRQTEGFQALHVPPHCWALCSGKASRAPTHMALPSLHQ